MADTTQYRHLLLRGTAATEAYTYPKPVRGKSLGLPPRNRGQHGNRLLAEIQQARQELERLRQQRLAAGVAGERGIYLEFESTPGFELALNSLERQQQGIELVAVREVGDTMFATVFVPEGQMTKLVRLVEAYVQRDTRWGKPQNQRLVESIELIRGAALEAFWTDSPGLLPQPGTRIAWEIWLRVGGNRERIFTDFTDQARQLGITVGATKLSFPDRTVVVAHATREQMSSSAQLLDCLAELRRAKEPPSFFAELSPREQREWVDALRARLEGPREDAPAVCLLDTGVNRNHPLLGQALLAEGCQTCNPPWGTHDHHGHGTEMAGLALFGDLTDVLTGDHPLVLEHQLESVKLLPPPGQPATDPELYGAITQQAVSRADIAAPGRSRAICMAVTAPDYRDRGQPSSWSGELDNICSGAADGVQRLLLVSAGNVDEQDWRFYPDYNEVAQVQDPGQAWNALTVGAYTKRDSFDTQAYPGWSLVARPGTLSPTSSTSVSWQSQWPNKPEIVLEGGNAARDPGSGDVAPLDDLVLLTTHGRLAERLLVPTWATSAATAQAARMAAILMARYPELRPETIRALLVHSANWTDEMIEEFSRMTPARRAEVLVRRYGYGVPDLDWASWSASNLLTLVAQEELRPFDAPKGGRVPTRDLHLHTLPWPRDQLLALQETIVELRVTLSYYVEPSPARRGWRYRHRYQSHGLRFAMRNPEESLEEFRARISKDAQEDEAGSPSFSEPGWQLGKIRDRGSLHSDRWRGTAAALAERNHLAVFPVGGWWKERPQLGRWRNSVRYSLVVSIETPVVEVDIYTPVAATIKVVVPAVVT